MAWPRLAPVPVTVPDKRSAAGAAAERAAAVFLVEQHGYRIVDRNFRTRFGEIDLVAEDGDELCFVEVRSRSSSRYGLALETIGAEKRRRIALTARRYLVEKKLEHRACRFDVVTIQDGGRPELLRDAFELEG